MNSFFFFRYYPKLPKMLVGMEESWNGPCLLRILKDLFSGPFVFEKLTSISFGNEVIRGRVSKGMRMHACSELLHHIGKNCPNVKVFDLTHCNIVSPDLILMLLFFHPHGTLHQYTYHYPCIVGKDGRLLQDEKSCQVLTHETPMQGHCPWCPSEWTNTTSFLNTRFNEQTVYPIDDRMYELVRQEDPSNIKYLCNLIKISDLIKGITTPFMWSKRPDYRNGNDEHSKWKSRETSVDYNTKAPWENDWAIMNPLTNSLQELKLNPDSTLTHHKCELLPFLLKALPKLKSLGPCFDITYGLKMIRDIPELNGISAENVEVVSYSFPRKSDEIDRGWANEAVWPIIRTFAEDVAPFPPSYLGDIEAFIREGTADEIELLARMCPQRQRFDHSPRRKGYIF